MLCCCCTQTRGPFIKCTCTGIYRLFVRVIKGNCNTNKFCNQNKSIILFSPSFIIRLKPNGRNGIMSNGRFKLANSEDLWSADFTEPTRSSGTVVVGSSCNKDDEEEEEVGFWWATEWKWNGTEWENKSWTLFTGEALCWTENETQQNYERLGR